MRASTHASASGAPSAAYLELAHRPRAELETAFLRGHAPDPERLVGWEFRGLNVPALARVAGVRKFIKGFERRDGDVFGYNTPAVQNRSREPWIARARGGRPPRRFGWYRVVPVDAAERDNAYLHAFLLDYGRGGNSLLDPTAHLRDYLVQVDPANPDLYLGKAYYALGPARVPLTFFLLERWRRAA
jgi:hypothetical protein